MVHIPCGSQPEKLGRLTAKASFGWRGGMAEAWSMAVAGRSRWTTAACFK